MCLPVVFVVGGGVGVKRGGILIDCILFLSPSIPILSLYLPLFLLLLSHLPCLFAGVFAVFLQGALPLAIALFPQKGSIAASALEPQFQNKVDSKTGKAIETYTYNKGV